MTTPPKFPLFNVCFLLFFLCLKLSQATTKCHPQDKKILLQIKNHFNNASPFSIWNPNTDCCNWANFPISNVGCYDDANPGRVTSLNIAYSTDVVGEIPSEVGELSFLITLSFYDTPNLTGSIPRSITKLTKLQGLTLSSNNLTGTIPDFLSEIKSLQLLDLSGNSFTGTIPSSLSQLPNLFELYLFRNQLTGSLPESFGSFKTGITLQVNENKLSGTIPSSLGYANLTTLDVSKNQFTGDVSFLFARNKPLNTIILRQNKFKFDFTKVDLPQGLRGLDMAYNEIYGSLPKRLGQLSLSFIDVSYNQLCGQIPTGRRLKQFPPVLFAHNKCLCGVPLPPCNNKM